MKRTYITPATEIVKVAAQQMIAASGITFDPDYTVGEGVLNDDYEDGVLSKGLDFDLW